MTTSDILWILCAIAGLSAAGGAVFALRRRFRRAGAKRLPVAAAVGFPPEHERRRSPRRAGVALPALLTESNRPESEQPVLIIERSDGGLRLATEWEKQPNTILRIRAGTAPPETPWVAIMVRHCRQANGRWEIGCQFLEPPPWNVLVLFG